MIRNLSTLGTLALLILALAACDPEESAAKLAEPGLAPAQIAPEQVSAAAQAPVEVAPASVDAQRLQQADKDPGNWMSYGRTYDEQRFSPLTQVNTDNVSKLG